MMKLFQCSKKNHEKKSKYIENLKKTHKQLSNQLQAIFYKEMAFSHMTLYAEPTDDNKQKNNIYKQLKEIETNLESLNIKI